MQTFILNLDVKNRWRWWTLWGTPIRTFKTPRGATWVFPSDTSIGLSRQWLNTHGVIRWECLILRTLTPGDRGNRIPCVTPGAELICHTYGHDAAASLQDYAAALRSRRIDPMGATELHRAAAPYLRLAQTPPVSILDSHASLADRGVRS